MALNKGELHVQFRGGIDRKSDSKTVSHTQLLALENGVFTRATSIAKRNGYAALGQGVDASSETLTQGIRLTSRDDELIQFELQRAFSHQPEADQWSNTGTVFSVTGSDRPVVRTGTQQTTPDHASSGGVTVYAWEDSRGGVWYTVTDTASGRIHVAPTQAHSSAISPRCARSGEVLHIYYAVPILARIEVIVVNPATPSATLTPSVLVDDLSSTSPVYDVSERRELFVTTPGAPVIAWHEHATDAYRLGFVDPSGVLGGPATGHSSAVTVPSAISATSPISISNRISALDIVAVVAEFGGVTVVRFFDGNSFSSAGSFVAHSTPLPQRIASVIVPDSDPASVPFPRVWVVCDFDGLAPSDDFSIVSSGTILGLVTGPTTLRSVGLASRAWTDDLDSEDAFAYFVHDTTYFNTFLALRLSDYSCIARSLPGSAAGSGTRKHLPSARAADGIATIALPYRERVLGENNDQFRETGIRLVTLRYESEDSHQTSQLGRGLYLAGACPQHYDGRQWTEQGFHVGPELITTVQAVGGSMTSSTTYLYRAWYEWTDASGEVHRGPVSFGTTVTMGASDTQVTLTLPTLRVTKKPNVRICVARSESAKTGKTASLFRVTSADPNTSGSPNGFVANDPTVDTVTFVDRMGDAVVVVQEPLYTNGGLLSNDPAALGSLIAGGKSRLFCNDPSDGNIIRHSQEIEDGFGVEFAPELQVRCDPFGGDVTALAVQDERVYAFKSGALFAFQGDGPTASGDTATTGFSKPQLVTSDVGCTDPASLVLTPVGHMFKSEKGIYLLDRSGSVSYVGAAVEAFNAQRITAASVLPGRTQVVFLTDDGATLLYDYLFQQWSTFTNHAGRDAIVIGGQYFYLTRDGRVFRETPGVYSDAGRRIKLRLETAWIHVASALQGFQRFWNLLVLGTWISPHQLGLQYRTDYDTAWSDPVWYDATGDTLSTGWLVGGGANPIGIDPITGSVYGEGDFGDGPYGGSPPDIYQWMFHIGGRGQSVQFRFEDFEKTGLAGASFELTEMIVEGGVAGTARKPNSAARSA